MANAAIDLGMNIITRQQLLFVKPTQYAVLLKLLMKPSAELVRWLKIRLVDVVLLQAKRDATEIERTILPLYFPT